MIPFAGLVTEDFQEWLRKSARLATAQGWDDRSKLVQGVSTILQRGSMKLLSQNVKQKYAQLLRSMQQRFTLTQLADVKVVELHDRPIVLEKRLRITPVCGRLTRQAWSEMDGNAQELLMKRVFIAHQAVKVAATDLDSGL